MTKHYDDFNEDDAFDENGLLRDGYKTLVSLTMRDLMTPSQQETATKRAKLTDGNGNCDVFAFSRPGFRILADAAINDARGAGRQEYLDYITNAWRTKPPRI